MPMILETIKKFDNEYFYLNMWFVGMPMTALMCGALAAQLIISAEKLIIWAHGNLFFVALSLYAIVQFLMSIPLLFEIDFIVAKYKELRVFNLFFGNIFNAIWFMFASQTIFPNWNHMDNLWNKDPGDVQIFMNLGLGYIMLATLPNVFMNLVLTFKEMQFQYYTVAADSINL